MEGAARELKKMKEVKIETFKGGHSSSAALKFNSWLKDVEASVNERGLTNMEAMKLVKDLTEESARSEVQFHLDTNLEATYDSLLNHLRMAFQMSDIFSEQINSQQGDVIIDLLSNEGMSGSKSEGDGDETKENKLPRFGPEPDFDNFDFQSEIERLPFKLVLGPVDMTLEQQKGFIRMIYEHKIFSLHDEDLGYCDKLEHLFLQQMTNRFTCHTELFCLSCKEKLENV